MKRVLFFILMAVSCSSCSRQEVYGRREVIGNDVLASAYVDTPDPAQEENWRGEKLVYGWSLPRDFILTGKEYLQVRILFATLELKEFEVPIHRRSGVKEFFLVGDDFKAKRGIATYDLKLMQGDRLIKEWQHQLWVEPVILDN